MYTKNVNNGDISDYCNFLLDNLPIDEIYKNNVRDLIKVGENKVAIEILCDNIYDYKIKIDRMFLTQLALLCCYLKIDNYYIDYLYMI